MPPTEENLKQDAERIVQGLLTSYLELNLHDASGGDPEVGLAMEHTFQAKRAAVIDLVVAGLQADAPPIL